MSSRNARNARGVIVGIVAGVSMAALASRGTTSQPLAGTSTTGDAGAPSDAAEAAITEVPFALVAEGSGVIHGMKTPDGRIVFYDGPMVWEAKPDGALESIFSAAEMAKLVPDDDTVVGYSTTREIHSVHGSPSGMLVFEAYGDRRYMMTHSAGKLTEIEVSDGEPLAARVFRGHLLAWNYTSGQFAWADGADLPLPIVPSDVSLDANQLYDGPDGALVAMPHRYSATRSQSVLLVWPRDMLMPIEVAFPPDESRCNVIPSFANRVVLECGMKGYALEGTRLVMTYNRTNPYISPKASEDASLTMYVASEGKVFRCPPCTPRDVPKVAPQVQASYALYGTEFVERDGNRAWQSLAVTTNVADRSPWPEIVYVLARGPNDVWVVARSSGRTQIFHTSAPPAKPKLLPDAAGARIALRNMRPPARWTGPCDQVYVRLGSDAEAIMKRSEEITKLLEPPPNDLGTEPYTWALVEGTLGDQHGVGVVLGRRDPSQKLARMETAVRKLVSMFATGPANEPPVYCTLPVLERKLLPAY